MRRRALREILPMAKMRLDITTVPVIVDDSVQRSCSGCVISLTKVTRSGLNAT
jgi:hypothetical protein